MCASCGVGRVLGTCVLVCCCAQLIMSSGHVVCVLRSKRYHGRVSWRLGEEERKGTVRHRKSRGYEVLPQALSEEGRQVRVHEWERVVA